MMCLFWSFLSLLHLRGKNVARMSRLSKQILLPSVWTGECSALVFSLQLQLVTYDILGHCHTHLRLRLRRRVETFTRHSFYINLMIYFVEQGGVTVYFARQRIKMRRMLRSIHLKIHSQQWPSLEPLIMKFEWQNIWIIILFWHIFSSLLSNISQLMSKLCFLCI